MTGSLILDSAISLGAIALMVACAWVFFPTKPQAVSKDLAAERLAFDEPDFHPREWLLDRNGRAALAVGDGGEAALVSRLGIDLVTRRFRAGDLDVAAEEGGLVIRPSDPGSRKIRLAAEDAAEWARKLSPASGK